MLNPVTNERELAYVVKIDEIRPIEGYDRVEHARVGGWWVIVRKDQFKIGDLAIYIEVDSKTPEKEPFMFLDKRNFKVKTLKMCKVISQGLLMSFTDFPMEEKPVGTFLTKELGITYADAEDNRRKAPSADKYKKMAGRHPEIFKLAPVRWLMRRNWGKKLLFLFFGKAKDKKSGWPAWVVKTDEERCQNMPWLFPGTNEEWIATEKIDGTSTTFTMRGFGRSREFYVCSRNVVFDKPDKKCFYETNVYTEMAEKYDIEKVLAEILDMYSAVCEFVTLQGETYGESVQKRDYGLKGRDFMAFNLILGFEDGHTERMNPREMTDFLVEFGIPCVPIVDEHFKIPATCDELLNIATGISAVDGGMREGLVFRSQDGTKSFKAVSNEFLLAFHSQEVAMAKHTSSETQKLIDTVLDYFDTIVNYYPTDEFLEVVGTRGGEYYTYRFYYSGLITER